MVKWRWYFNIFVTFLISGLWHGANWTFVIWGGLNGLFMIIETIIYKKSLTQLTSGRANFMNKLASAFRIVLTFCLICITWIFFRANDLNDSIYILTNMFSGLKDFFINISDLGYISGVLSSFGVVRFEFFLSIFFIGLLLALESFNFELSIFERIKHFPVLLRWTVYYLIIGMLVFFGTYNSTQQFIYFQF